MESVYIYVEHQTLEKINFVKKTNMVKNQDGTVFFPCPKVKWECESLKLII